MAGSYSNSIFCFMRNLPNVLKNDCTNSKYIFINSIQGFPFLHILTNIPFVF